MTPWLTNSREYSIPERAIPAGRAAPRPVLVNRSAPSVSTVAAETPWRLWVNSGLVLLTVLVYGLYFLHLTADFPNQFPLQDWAKYTDEGWYANAAIRHFLWGHWYLHGDFNPAVALPVWPLLEAALFHFTGVSVQAVRALTVVVFGFTLLFAYLLVRRWESRTVALSVVAIAAASPFLYAFDRIAILEPLILCLMLAAMLLADTIARSRTGPALYGRCVLLGLLLVAMVLTKTTAAFVFPSILYMLWYPQRKKLRQFWMRAAVPALVAAALGSIYYFALVRAHYKADFFYLFKANNWGHPANWKLWILAGYFSIKSLLWPDRGFAYLAGAVLLLSLFRPFRQLWRIPLYPASVLAAGTMLFFVFWHNNQQPRYFLVVAMPYFFMAALGVAAILRQNRRAGTVAGAVVLLLAANNLRQTIGYVAHPEYTWINAARNLTAYINSHPNGNRLLLSISGDEISLMTGLPAICDDFGTYDLPDRVDTYQPGWYASWNDVDPGTLEDIHANDRLVKVASFPALNDPNRNVLILYKMLPQPGPDEGVVVEE